MSMYDDAAKAIEQVAAPAGALVTLLEEYPELAPLLTPADSIEASIGLLRVNLAAITPKPLMTGLISRDNPNASKTYDPAYGGYIGRVDWAALEGTQGVFSSAPIDAIIATAKARGKYGAIRFYSGDQAPAWAKNIGTGPVKIYNPTDKVWGSVGPWWDPAYQDAYEAAIAYIASRVESEPLIRMISMSLGGMIYPEPFLRSIGDNTTHTNLATAGLTTAKDHAAIKRGIDLHAKHFPTTRTFLAFNPGQDFDKRSIDLAWSDEASRYFRLALGERGVFYSTSLDAQADKAPADQHVYQTFVSIGGPRAIQTEQNSRVSNWAEMMQYGISLGMCAVETSPGGWETMQTLAQAEAYSAALAKNAAAE